MGVVPSRCMSETMCMASSFLIVADDDIIQRVFARAMHVELVYGECYVHEIQPVIADILHQHLKRMAWGGRRPHFKRHNCFLKYQGIRVKRIWATPSSRHTTYTVVWIAKCANLHTQVIIRGNRQKGGPQAICGYLRHAGEVQ